MKNAKYTEPTNYFPKDVRKEFKLGEFAEKPETKEKKERNVTNEDFRKYLKGE